MNNKFEILIVGCGLSGAVMAEQFASQANKKVLVIDKRNHIGGNIYDFYDEETGILMNQYGAHIFHTNNEMVWNYVRRFAEWRRYDHEVLAKVDDKYVNVPVNINTVNNVCEENIKNEEEMNEWLLENQVKYDEITNSEEMCKSRVGEICYEKIFKNYTYKQWNKFPEELDKSVLERIPVRNNFDNRYFTDKYQALPYYGYTDFVNKLLKHENIEVKLLTDYFDFIKNNKLDDFETVIYTGPIDAFYKNEMLGPLEYRSIDFQVEKYFNMNYYQQKAVINYPGLDTDYTRIVEYKHFLNQESYHTVIVKEVTKDKGEPYYPVPNKRNLELFEEYKKLALRENKIHFLGRLANYKYFNMDEAILNALEYFINHFNKNKI